MKDMTVEELIALLQKQPKNARVVASWEGVFRSIKVYRAKAGEVIIDADGEDYKDRIQRGVPRT
jgi:hypothetical protein